MSEQVIVGAVAYDPKVVKIWEGIRDYFCEAGVPTDYVLFSNYEAQVEALFRKQIDIAWNTNVAYVRCQQRAEGACRILGMRNTDQDFTSRLIVRNDSGISGLADLRGKRLGVGSADSAQAAILPLHFLREAGIDPSRDLRLTRFDSDVGKHGDTGSSELEVLRALHEGTLDAGMIGYAVWLIESEAGHVNSSLVKSVWTSPPYDHCNFTALPDLDEARSRRWTDARMKMDYNNERWRRIMDLEGVKQWLPGRQEGYQSLFQALT
jgi:ABC-type phosphate/phosphonate transport system substrate-binding protein